MTTKNDLPLKVGDLARFINYSWKAGPPGVLGLPLVGEVVKITDVFQGQGDDRAWYVKWEGGDNHPSGGLFLREFEKVESPG